MCLCSTSAAFKIEWMVDTMCVGMRTSHALEIEWLCVCEFLCVYAYFERIEKGVDMCV